MLNETFWVAVAFFIFVGLVYKPVKRTMADGLDKRAARIKSELEEAVRLKEEAQTMLASYQRKHMESAKEAEEIISHAKTEAERIVSSANKRVEEELAKRTELAIQKIAQAEASVLNEIRNNAVDITISAAKSLIIDNLGKEVAEEIMSTAISGIDRKFH